jgi:Zn-dependent M28 family amino/carboxypeptidase
MDDRLRSHLRALISERHPVSSPVGLRRAQDYIAEEYRRLGLKVSLHAFRALGGTYKNVVGTLPPARSALRRSKPPLIIAAHYDTVQDTPGADDNASGLAAMLEIAGTLHKASLSSEVRFIATCLEEHDLLGSVAYAASLREANEEILGAVVLECVGYTSDREGSQTAPPATPIAVPRVGDFLGIVANTASAPLAKDFEQAAKREVTDLKTVSLVVPAQGEQLPDTRRSDHAAFWQFGYPALMLTDTANFRNPHYHRSTDTLETLDISFIRRVVQAVSAMATSL